MSKDFVEIFHDHIEIQIFENELPLTFFNIWLRDHCRCSECYNKKTHQVSSNVLDIPLNITLSTCEILDGSLKIIWKDGHKTEFLLKWLKDINFPMRSKKEIILWNKNTVSTFKDITIPANMYLHDSNDGVKQLLQSLLKYGFGFVTGVNPTMDATELIAKRIAPIQKTLFGEMWQVTNDYHHDDTAYTNIALGAHTDNTYFNEPAGLQVFQMFSHSGSGGETLLIDGFNAATNLKIRNKQLFDMLCNNALKAEYIEEGYHFSATDYVVKLHPVTKELFQIRYNIYDRAVFNTIATENIPKFYEAYQTLGKEICDPENELWLKLEPGSVLFIDNWRVLHGRAAYTGKRNLGGCYISRSEWLSKAEALGLNIV